MPIKSGGKSLIKWKKAKKKQAAMSEGWRV